ncbi:hypothetical protein ACWD3J_13925 [Streptomyces sp. NPDC002755]
MPESLPPPPPQESLTDPRQHDWDETPAQAAAADRRYWNED